MVSIKFLVDFLLKLLSKYYENSVYFCYFSDKSVILEFKLLKLSVKKLNWIVQKNFIVLAKNLLQSVCSK